MSLESGARLGPYEIVSALGAGGMGEVYKARDTRLDRQVAIKILSASMSESPEARDRFDREAWAISRLSHPHVCSIFDVGHDAGTAYLVMELLDGETLHARIHRGPLPIPQVLSLGAQIAGALDAAHRQGIVHRDLKPGNVMITNSGVKLLDFGLAKALEPLLPAPSGDLPTATAVAPLTAKGTWLGTAPYMAPELLLGHPADARSDVFAIGAVLYEMVAGRRAFGGETAAVISSAIVHQNPVPPSSVRPGVPPSLDRLILECLAKDPDRRWQNAHDVALQLAAIDDDRQHPAVGSASRGSAHWLGWAVAALASVLAIATLLWPRQLELPSDSQLDLQLLPPPTNSFAYSPDAVTFAVSPDGRDLAFVVRQADGGRRLWRRGLTSIEATPIAGTENATSVFWSPDGGSIGFFAAGKLKRLDLASGVAVPICDVDQSIGITGTWGADGQILFASVEGKDMFAVSTAGGAAKPLFTVDSSRNEARVLFPSFLPDGRRFLYLLRLTDRTGWLMLGGSDQAPRRIMPVESNVRFVEPNHLVFARGGTLIGQAFDPLKAQIVGEPFAIAPAVRFFLTTGAAAFTASGTGSIVYQSDRDRERLAWVDRAGREVEPIGTPGDYLDMRITASGRLALLSRALPATGTFDVWSLDLARGTETRLTLDDVATEFAPVLLPGERELIYASPRGGAPRLIRRNLATGQADEFWPGRQFQSPEDVSPDGSLLAFGERTETGPFNLWALHLSGPPNPSVLHRSPFHEEHLRFSPDGRYYTFSSLESGRQEVYITPVSGGTRTPVSKGGATGAQWSRDGREILYLTPDDRMVSVPVRTTPTLELGAPTTLFALGSQGWRAFDVTPDGKRFLALIPVIEADEQPLKAIVNWRAQARE